jgi:hypothetical protein
VGVAQHDIRKSALLYGTVSLGVIATSALAYNERAEIFIYLGGLVILATWVAAVYYGARCAMTDDRALRRVHARHYARFVARGFAACAALFAISVGPTSILASITRVAPLLLPMMLKVFAIPVALGALYWWTARPIEFLRADDRQ